MTTAGPATLMTKAGPATMMTKAGPLESGRDLKFFVPGEYAFLRRFRLRWLHAFLWLQGCHSPFFAMLKQTDVYFCVNYLSRFVCNGLWTEALQYIAPRLGPGPRSMEAGLLIKFLSQHRKFQLEVDRQQLRVNMTPAWDKAAEIVRDLANRTPEFRNKRLLPAGPMGQHDVLPIGFGLFAPFRRRWHVNKYRRPASSSAIAKLYLDKRRSSLQLSSGHSNQEPLSPAEFMHKAFDWLQSSMYESLQVLRRPPELNQGCALQSSVREGAPVAHVVHALFGNGINSAKNSTTPSMAKTGTVACPAKSSEIISAANDGTSVTGNVINPECSSLPLTIDEGAPAARVCHAMFGNGINSAENSAILSMAETGTLACPAKISEIVSAANDGTCQEVSYTESARQGSYPRKRPMAEQQKDYMDIKKQRTAGANGEASTPVQHIIEGDDARAAGHLPPARSNLYC